MLTYARTTDHNKVLKDKVLMLEEFDKETFFNFISQICESMDLSTPVILDKHYQQMTKFNHCIFLPNEFMESVDFERFIVELIDEKSDKWDRT